MDFSLSQSQELLQKSAIDFLEKECKENAREMEKTDEGYSPKIWKKMAELGWMGLCLPSEYGGMDGDMLEMVLLIEQMGRRLLPGPFIPTAVVCALSVLEHGTEAQKKEILPKLIDGDLIIVPADIEPMENMGNATIKDSVAEKDDQFIINGTRLFVPFAHMADMFILKINHPGEKTTLLLADAKAAGVTCTVLEALASDRPCEVLFDNVAVPKENVLGKIGEGDAVVKRMASLGAMAHSAYLSGLLEEVLDRTVEYAKGRVQFGRPIGSFQAIQHQAANMKIDVDQTKYLVYHAGWNMGLGLSADKEIAMAKARASDASRRVCLLGVKIHGGTGIIDEYDTQLYFRRAKAHEHAYGDGRHHRETVAREVGLKF